MATTVTEKDKLLFQSKSKKKGKGRPISEVKMDYKKKEDLVFRKIYNGPPEISGVQRPLTTQERFWLSLKDIKDE